MFILLHGGHSVVWCLVEFWGKSIAISQVNIAIGFGKCKFPKHAYHLRKQDFIFPPAVSENRCSALYVLDCTAQCSSVTYKCYQQMFSTYWFFDVNCFCSTRKFKVPANIGTYFLRSSHVHHFAQTRVKFKVISCCSGPCCSLSLSLYLLCKSPAASTYVSPSKQDEYLKTGFPKAIARLCILWSLHHFNSVTF